MIAGLAIGARLLKFGIGIFTNPYVLLALGAAVLLYSAYSATYSRGYKAGIAIERETWKARHTEAEKLARVEQKRLQAERDKENAELLAEMAKSRDEAAIDAQYLRTELARQHALARVAVPRSIAGMLDAGRRPGTLPGTAPVAGRAEPGIAAAVPGSAADQSVALGALLERVRHNSGVCERNTQRLGQCLEAYEHVRSSFVRLRDEGLKSAGENLD
jgi:hypothetical protein